MSYHITRMVLIIHFSLAYNEIKSIHLREREREKETDRKKTKGDGKLKTEQGVARRIAVRIASRWRPENSCG